VRAASRTILWALSLCVCRGEGEVLDLSAADAGEGRCGLAVIARAEGLDVARALTSDWVEGSCYELTLQNSSDAPLTWWVQVDVEGSTVDRWNHAARHLGAGVWEWTGIAASNNVELAAQTSAVVGTCLEC